MTAVKAAGGVDDPRAGLDASLLPRPSHQHGTAAASYDPQDAERDDGDRDERDHEGRQNRVEATETLNSSRRRSSPTCP
jgi:hypothetical protein